MIVIWFNAIKCCLAGKNIQHFDNDYIMYTRINYHMQSNSQSLVISSLFLSPISSMDDPAWLFNKKWKYILYKLVSVSIKYDTYSTCADTRGYTWAIL